MNRNKLMALLVGIVLMLGINHSTLAYDHSVTLGPSALQFANLEYEQSVSDKTTFNVFYGISWIGIIALSNEVEWPSYGLGINHYFNQSLKGGYVGLQLTHVEPKGDAGIWEDIFSIMLGQDINSHKKCEPFEYATASLGYKMVSQSGFTFDSAIQAIILEEGWGCIGKLTLGHTW